MTTPPPLTAAAGLSRLLNESESSRTGEELPVNDDEQVPKAQYMIRTELTNGTTRTTISQDTPSVILTADGSDDVEFNPAANSRHSAYSSRPASSTYDFGEGTTLGRVLNAQLAGCLNEQALAEMLALQEKTLDTATQTHDTLAAFNEFAEARYAELQKRLEQHVTSVLALRKDLDGVFRRLRSLKEQCRSRYPDANQTVRALYPPATYLAEGDDDWEGDDDDDDTAL
ncbi:hypothetical protein BDF22DRAFT_690720 [Syncephalis plumigaleata]|nr:hypothetical protein BDF22DRAFT_690720 [Syncephalis plumigaleata]